MAAALHECFNAGVQPSGSQYVVRSTQEIMTLVQPTLLTLIHLGGEKSALIRHL